MAAQALAAQAVASRLQRQEEDIRWLCAEVQRLRDEQLRGPERGQAEGPRLTREVAQLQAENRDLHQRLCGLRLRLAEQRGPGARRAAAHEVTGRPGARTQRVPTLYPGAGRAAGCVPAGALPTAHGPREPLGFHQPPNRPAGIISRLFIG